MKLFPISIAALLVACGGGGGGDDDVVECVTYDGTFINATRCEFDRGDPDLTQKPDQVPIDVDTTGGATPVPNP